MGQGGINIVDAIKYLKFDLRISRKTLLTIIPALIFVAYMFWKKGAYIFGMAYLLLFLVICAITPFSVQGNENLECLYHSFPTKVSKRVFGRFIYLIIGYIVIFSIEGILIMYLSSIDEINNIEIITICLCEMITAIMCFIEYIICYRWGIKSAITSALLYIMPGLFVFMLPSFLIDNSNYIDTKINFILQNKNLIIMLCTFIIIAIGYNSYLISCRICKRKEV